MSDESSATMQDDYAPKRAATGFARREHPESRLGVLLTRVVLLGVAVTATALEHGMYRPALDVRLGYPLQLAVFLVYAVDVWWGARRGRLAVMELRPGWLDLALAGLSGVMALFAVLAYGTGGPARGWWYGFETGVFGLLMVEMWRLVVAVSRRLHRPGLLLPLSFGGLVAVGAVLLALPRAAPPGEAEVSWIDALFTSTSAVCVTGLIVRDTATQFSGFGQAVIAVLIQMGGLGIMVFGSVLALLMGTGLSLRDRIGLSTMLQDQPLSRITRYVGFVVGTTLGIELIGAAMMMPLWGPEMPLGERAAQSLFHGVSAFCNAGFSLFSDSLEGYRYSLIPHVVVVPLIVLGGVGFPVLDNVYRALRARWRRWRRRAAGLLVRDEGRDMLASRLTLHTKLVLVMTAGLYGVGVIGIVAAQLGPRVFSGAGAGLEPASAVGVVADASFMSVTARTAGFNSMPMDAIEPGGRFTLMALMMIGASSGGTGGGMKTTTLAVTLLAVWAAVRQRGRVEAMSRTISDDLVRAAATLGMSFIALVTLSTFLLCLSESARFEVILFEAVSAASTTGLSLGLTPQLTTFGKVVIIVTMFLGRVGPLALLGALLVRERVVSRYTYPRESVLIG